jgi:hypothetical protein
MYTQEQQARIEAANAKMREKEARKRATGSMRPPSRTEGRFASRKALMETRRRARFAGLMTCKRRRVAENEAAFKKLAALSQDMNMY